MCVDDATPDGDQTATSGTLSVTATGVSWTGSIPVGGSVTVTGTVTVNNPDTGNKVMTTTSATTAAGSNCPAGGTDPLCSQRAGAGPGACDHPGRQHRQRRCRAR